MGWVYLRRLGPLEPLAVLTMTMSIDVKALCAIVILPEDEAVDVRDAGGGGIGGVVQDGEE